MSDAWGHSRSVAKKHKVKVELDTTGESADGSYDMKVYDFSVYLTIAVAFDYVITLPPVVEASFLGPYVIYLRDRNTSYEVVIKDNNDDASLGNITLDADDEHVVLVSDGEQWFELVTGYS